MEQDFLGCLIGRQLSSVEFVQDYIQLWFDSASLQAITVPEVIIGQKRFNWNDEGYRDQLCARIGHIVVNTAVIEGSYLKIHFDDKSFFHISLLPESYRTAEAIIFIDNKNGWTIL